MHVGMVYVGTVVNLLSIKIYISQNRGLKKLFSDDNPFLKRRYIFEINSFQSWDQKLGSWYGMHEFV